MQNEYVRYAPSIEVISRRETELIEKIVRSIGKTNRSSFARYHHAIRQRHAKSPVAVTEDRSALANLLQRTERVSRRPSEK